MSPIRALTLPALLAALTALPLGLPDAARAQDVALDVAAAADPALRPTLRPTARPATLQTRRSGPREASPGFDNRVLRTRDLPSGPLRDARRRMLAGETISLADMRGLADSGDGLAAFRFAQRLEAEGDPALLSDAALYYATAAYTNRDSAVAPLVRLLRQGDVEISPRRLEHIETSLRALALAGDDRAAAALVGFYSTGRPFGLQPGRAFELRRELALAGDADAAMTLVMEAVSGASSEPIDRAGIVALLDVVATSDHVGQRATAENLRRMLEAGAFDAALADAAPTIGPETPGPEAPSPQEVSQ